MITKYLRKDEKKSAKIEPSSNFQWQPIIAVGLFGVFAIIFYSYALVGAEHILFYECRTAEHTHPLPSVSLGEAFDLSAVEVRDKYSLWILLSHNPEIFRSPNLEKRARAVTLRRAPLLWTDDYSNLFVVLGRQQLAVR